MTKLHWYVSFGKFVTNGSLSKRTYGRVNSHCNVDDGNDFPFKFFSIILKNFACRVLWGISRSSIIRTLKNKSQTEGASPPFHRSIQIWIHVCLMSALVYVIMQVPIKYKLFISSSSSSSSSSRVEILILSVFQVGGPSFELSAVASTDAQFLSKYCPKFLFLVID